MTTVREGWVVFDGNGNQMTYPCSDENAAWWEACRDEYDDPGWLRYRAYTCRRVRVTIETIEELEQGESE